MPLAHLCTPRLPPASLVLPFYASEPATVAGFTFSGGIRRGGVTKKGKGRNVRKFTAAAMMVTIALLAGCGGDTHESVTAEMIAQMKQMTTVLEGVKDEASAKAAVPQLDAIATRMEEIEKRGKKLPELDAKQKEQMTKTFEKDLTEIETKLKPAVERVMTDPKIAKELEKPMGRIMALMTKG